MIKHTIDCRINQRDKIPMNSQMFKKNLFWSRRKKINLQIVGKLMGKQVCTVNNGPQISTMNGEIGKCFIRNLPVYSALLYLCHRQYNKWIWVLTDKQGVNKVSWDNHSLLKAIHNGEYLWSALRGKPLISLHPCFRQHSCWWQQ